MHTKSISGTVTTTVTLGADGYANHLTITDTGAVEPSVAGATAIVAPASIDHARVINHGTVLGGAGTSATPNGGIGIDFAAAGTVSNSGNIAGGSSANVYAAIGGIGVSLEQGGTLSNTGTILGGSNNSYYYRVSSMGGVGVDLGATGKIVNHGVIGGGNGADGNGGFGSIGVDLAAGGSLSNDGTISGGNAGESTLATDGTTGGAGILLGDEASITNSGTIVGGSGSNVQGGYAVGGAGATGIVFQAAGSLINHDFISGGDSGFGNDGGKHGGDGVSFAGAALLTNTGTIEGGALNSTAVFAASGGSVTNSGTIAGGDLGGSGLMFGNSGTLTNSGDIFGMTGGYRNALGGFGVSMQGIGVITNTGTIAGGPGGTYKHNGTSGGDGVFMQGGTLVTFGTIAGGLGGQGGLGNGTPGDAVHFGTLTATLVVEPGAVFIGDVAANSTLNDTLELAGKGGTLTGLGTTVTGFTTITEDNSAHWVLSGSLSGDGSLTIGTGATLILDGPASIASIVFAGGGNELLRMETSSQITGTISGFGAGDVIDLRTILAASLTYDHGTLTLFDASHTILDMLHFVGNYSASDFTLKSDAHGGTGINYASNAAQHSEPAYAGNAHASSHPDATVFAPLTWHQAL